MKKYSKLHTRVSCFLFALRFGKLFSRNVYVLKKKMISTPDAGVVVYTTPSQSIANEPIWTRTMKLLSPLALVCSEKLCLSFSSSFVDTLFFHLASCFFYVPSLSSFVAFGLSNRGMSNVVEIHIFSDADTPTLRCARVA